MSITSDELNLLVYRYLLESGFVHAAYLFSQESLIAKSSVSQLDVPPGALVSFVQKGLEYVGIEEHLNEDGTFRDFKEEDYSLLSPHICQALSRRDARPNIPKGGAAAAAADLQQLQQQADQQAEDGSASSSSNPSSSSSSSSSATTPAAAAAAAAAAVAAASAPAQQGQQQPHRRHHAYAIAQQHQEQMEAMIEDLPAAQRLVRQQMVEAAAAAAGAKASGKSAEDQKQAAAASALQNGASPETVMAVIKAAAVAAESEGMEPILVLPPHGAAGGAGGAQPSATTPFEVEAREDICMLRGHASEVFVCAWHPQQDLLATGSADASCRLWDMDQAMASRDASQGAAAADENGTKAMETVKSGNTGASPDISAALVLRHTKEPGKKFKDVTAVSWNPQGNRLCTGCYDGHARMWDIEGHMVFRMDGHRGPVFSLKWDESAARILTGSYDNSVLVWDAALGTKHAAFRFHDGPVLDVDWRDAGSFASCSSDRRVLLCDIESSDSPSREFRGHSDEVNSVLWHPDKTMLASCSDDCTVKLWRDTDSNPVLDLRDHMKEVYAVVWAASPGSGGATGPNSSSSASAGAVGATNGATGNGIRSATGQDAAGRGARHLLSGSFDSTVKMWDVARGTCVQSFCKEAQPIYCLAVDNVGGLLATGSVAGFLNLWDLKNGKLITSFQGGGDIFDVRWNRTQQLLAATFSDGTVAVMDVRKVS